MAQTRSARVILSAQDRASKTIKGISAALTGLGAVAAAIGANQLGRLLVRGVRSALDASKEFGRQMSQVAGLTRSTGSEFSTLSDLAKDLGRSTVFSASQSAGAMTNFARAGFTVKEITGALKPTLSLAAAGQLELADAASITSNIMRALGKQTSDLDTVVDVLAAGSSSANLTVLDLGEGFKFVGASMRTLGVDLEEGVAALGLLANQGIETSMAGAQLRNMFAEIQKNTKDGITTFGRFRLELFDAEGNFVGLTETMRRMQAAGLDSTEVFGVFEKRLASVAAALLNAGPGAMQEMVDSLRDSEGEAGRLAEVFTQNLHGATTRLESALSGLRTEVGQQLEPAIVTLLDEALSPLVNELTDGVTQSDALRVALLAMVRDVAEVARPLEAFLRSEEASKLLQVSLDTLGGSARDAEKETSGLGRVAAQLANQFARVHPLGGLTVGVFSDLRLLANDGKDAIKGLGVVAEELSPRLKAAAGAGKGAAESLNELAGDGLVTTDVINRINELLEETGDEAEDATKDVNKLNNALDIGVADPAGLTPEDAKKRAQEIADAEMRVLEAQLALVGDMANQEKNLRMQILLAGQREEMEALEGNAAAQMELRRAHLLEQEALEQEFRDRAMEAIRAQTDAEIAEAERAADAKIGETERAARADRAAKISKANLESSIAELAADAIRLAFGKNKNAAIAAAVIDTWAAVNRTLASVPYPANIVAAAQIALQGLANVKKIKSQKFAQGGIIEGPPGVDAVTVRGAAGDLSFSAGELVADTRGHEARAILGGRAAIVPRGALGGGSVSRIVNLNLTVQALDPETAHEVIIANRQSIAEAMQQAEDDGFAFDEA